MAELAAWENVDNDESPMGKVRYEWRPNVKEQDDPDAKPEYLDSGQLIRRKYDDILLLWNEGEVICYCDRDEAESMIAENDPDYEFELQA